ncbi:MAG: HU family DNA-binding protein [Prevotella sp.]|nr:HU family DNA-binding protein [Prevotella sp.]
MGRLTIQEIAKVLVAKNGLDRSQANRFATELFAIIQERLEKNDQVKVKGLGTFKVITVDARESVSVRTGGRVMIEEHSKITFTPDATMKELVNKPFSQFETVVLNDNVEFDDLKEQPADSEFEDIKDDLTEAELVQLEKYEEELAVKKEESVIQQEEPVVQQEEPVVQQEEPVVQQEEPVVQQQEPIVAEPVVKQEEPVVEEPVVEVEQPKETPAVAPLVDVPEESPKDSVEESLEEEPEETLEEEPEETSEEVSDTLGHDIEEEKTNFSFKWIWIALGTICLVGISAAGGYYYGCQQTALAALSDTVVIRDTVYVPESQDTTSIKTLEGPAQIAEAPKAETPKAEEVKVEKPKAEAPKAEPAPEVDKYAEKDERVRLGAYRIVGLDHEVKVLQGQTFYSICRAHLGPDMECYIEVYNNLPRNPQIKAGQVIKIPKLQLKKRKKQ